jgi:hypothetical protein
LPLLPGHGLKVPAKKMNVVNLAEWQNEVDFAVKLAQQVGRQVSIGGLSTGGVLSTWKALISPDKITGGLFLFSAALDVGNFEQFVLSSDAALKILSIVDEKKHITRRTIDMLRGEQSTVSDPSFGIGDNPYRYSEMFYNGAAQLASLIGKIGDRYPKREDKYRDLMPPVFAAHSEGDQRAMIGEVQLLVNQHRPPSYARLYRIPASERVPHASVVLSADIAVTQRGQRVALEQRNPLFDDMMRDLKNFVSGQLERP